VIQHGCYADFTVFLPAARGPWSRLAEGWSVRTG
jgi:hypothetical protein